MEKSTQQQTGKKHLPAWLLVTIGILSVCVLFSGIWWSASGVNGSDDLISDEETSPASDESIHSSEQEQAEQADAFPVELEGLKILRAGEYSGIYMEDGSNEAVTRVMMLIVENTSDQDLQLARIDVEYAELTAEFEVTNIPAGEKVVLLEKNRAALPQEPFLSVRSRNVVFFPEKMRLQEDILQITGDNGLLKVTNISGTDIAGDILIYYKNCASDLLYGGITYRVRLSGGLAAGETAQIVSSYYTPDTCRLLMVTCAQT